MLIDYRCELQPLLLFENKMMHLALISILSRWKKNVLEMTLAAVASFASKVARQLILERYKYSLEEEGGGGILKC